LGKPAKLIRLQSKPVAYRTHSIW